MAITLMRGRQVTPSGMVPPPVEEDVISSPIISMPLSVASGGGGVGVLGSHNPSLGLFSVPSRQVFNQVCVFVTPAFGYVYVSVSRDVRSVAPSPSSCFNPASMLFLFSDLGFASLPSSMPSYSSLAFSLPLSSSSALTFSSLAPSASCTPLPLFSLPLVVSSVLPLSSIFFLGSLFSCSAVSSSCLLFHCSSLFAGSSSFVFCSFLFLRLLLALLWGFSALLPSSGSAFFRSLASPPSVYSVSFSSSLSSFGDPPGFLPLSYLSSSSLPSSGFGGSYGLSG